MLLPLLIGLAGAVAEPAPRFTAACRQERSAAHCTCVVTALSADPGGRFFLGMAELTARPDADQRPAYAALLARHGVDSTGGNALRQRGEAVGDAAVARCA